MLPSHAVSLDRQPRDRRDRGAVLVHVAVAMVGLLAFSALSIDLGALWVARVEAQNAADAAALSGAVTMMATDTSTEEGQNAVRGAAEGIAAQHKIWGEAVDVGSSVQVEVGSAACRGEAGECVRVAVHRGGGAGTPLPVFFSHILGVGSSHVAAYAIARAAVGNATACPAAVAVPDRWVDAVSNPIDSDADHGPTNRVFDLGVDTYTPPGPGSPGTGYTRDMIGPPYLDWRRFSLNDPAAPLGQLEFMTMDFRTDGTGEPIVPYRASILGCSGVHLRIGDEVPIFFGGREEVRNPFEVVYDLDSGTDWDDSNAANSPRLLTVAVFDPEDFVRQRNDGVAEPRVRIVNFMGVFVQAQTGHPLPAIVMPASGSFDGAAPNLDPRAAFLRGIALVR